MKELNTKRWSKAILVAAVVAAVIGIYLIGKRIYEYTGKKELWEWLELLTIPVSLAIVGAVVTIFQTLTARKTAREENKVNREIADERSQDQAFQNYLNRMGELSLKEDLRNSKSDSPEANLARAWTLVILKSVRGERGSKRKRSVVDFLYETNLIVAVGGKESVIVMRGADLGRADLSGAVLGGADFRGADLKGAHLNRADLGGADLREADLKGAHLNRADLRGSHLSGANLRGAHFSGAYFTGAYLTGAYLTGANLTEADLTRARLGGADLTEAQLNRANLTGAKISENALNRAILKDTTLPNGKKTTNERGEKLPG